MNLAQWKSLAIGIPAIIGFYFLASFFIDNYKSLDDLHKIYLSELVAAIIGITIFIVRKKIKSEQLEAYEFLMIVVMGVIAGVGLLPRDIINPILIIGTLIIILVVWFVYFGLGRYLGEEKKMSAVDFITILGMFIGLTILIIFVFNYIRLNELLLPY